MTGFDATLVDWKKCDGLLPAIVQDAETAQVLMLGYMNREALEQTQRTGLVTFFSRSKGRLWEKGETSGHGLELERMELDCDQDAVLVTARPRGPTCHRGSTSCFGEVDAPGLGWLARLAAVIEQRKDASPEGSYTARLLSGDIERIAKKVGEEGVEVALAAVAGGDRLVEEAADLTYHLLVLLNASGHNLPEVVSRLRERRTDAHNDNV